MTNSFYITTPIYYVNDSPHIGHAYTSIASDVIARFMRLSGNKVRFLTGTDEHGQKVEKAAHALNKDPQEFVDEVSKRFRDLSSLLNLSNDDFIRTTEERHKKTAINLWNTLLEKEYIYLGKYSGWYSVRDEAFFLEKDLVDGKAPTGAPVEWIEEPSYFFALSKFQDKLLAFYQEHPNFIQPESRFNEVVNFVKRGLVDLSVSRTSFQWGIKIPQDEQHVMYVWLDALANYLSSLESSEEELLQEFWPANLHIVGKDILRFHAIYWPAFLMAADIACPKQIFAHGWWTVDGEKMSKSLGNTVKPSDLVEEFGLDQTRYFLMREVIFGQDGNFSKSAAINRINSELANNIGNLAQRTLSFINKNAAGTVPAVNVQELYTQNLLASLAMRSAQYKESMNKLKLNQALDIIIELASNANSFIDAEAPWSLKKSNVARMNQVLYILIETIRYIAIMLSPFMPDAMNKLLDQLNIQEAERKINYLQQSASLKPGTNLPTPQGIFPRI